MPPRRGRRYLGPKSPQKCQLASRPRKFVRAAHHRPPYPPPREGAAGQITPIAQPAREGWLVWLRIWDRWCSSNAPFSVRHHVPGLEVGRVHGTSSHCCGRITARIADWVYVVAAARAAEVKAPAADSAARAPWRDRNGGLLRFVRFALLAAIRARR